MMNLIDYWTLHGDMKHIGFARIFGHHTREILEIFNSETSNNKQIYSASAGPFP